MKSQMALKDFLVETEDLLESMNSDVIRLGECVSTGRTDPGLLNSIFRSAHTLKGISGMFGFGEVTTLSHSLEDMLDGLRMGRVSLAQGVLDILFEALGLLTRLVRAKGKGEDIDVGAVDGLTERLKLFLSSQTACAALQPLDGIDKVVLDVLTEYEEHRLKENIKQGNNIFLIGAEFGITSFDEGLTVLTDRLKFMGEVIATLPSEGLSKEALHFEFLLGTARDEAYLKDNLGHLKIRAIKGQASPPVTEGIEPQAPQSVGGESFTLRGVSNTVRVDIARLDEIMRIVGEIGLLKVSISHIAGRLRLEMASGDLARELSRVDKDLEKRLKDLQGGVLDTRMVPISNLFERFLGVMRRLSKEMGKEVTIVTGGGDTRLDKLIIEEMADPLMHLLRNAIDHGIEAPQERERAGKQRGGTITIQAMQRGNHVVVEVKDDGSGIDVEEVRKRAVQRGVVEEETSQGLSKEEVLDFIFLPGFSTSEKVNEISGRGVGMDVVKRNISLVGGTIDVETEEGKGTRVILTLPITLAIIQALIVGVGQRYYAIPLNSILEVQVIQPDDIKTIEKREVIHLRDRTLPLLRLDSFFGLTPVHGGDIYCVVVGLAESRLGLLVNSLHDQQDIVLRSLGGLKDVSGIAGATDMGEKGTVLVLDVAGIINLTIMSVEKGYPAIKQSSNQAI